MTVLLDAQLVTPPGKPGRFQQIHDLLHLAEDAYNTVEPHCVGKQVALSHLANAASVLESIQAAINPCITTEVTYV